MQSFYSEVVYGWITQLRASRDDHPMRAYLISALEASHRGALTQIDLNEKYAALNKADAPGKYSETAFDFKSEANIWRKRAEQYASDLQALRI